MPMFDVMIVTSLRSTACLHADSPEEAREYAKRLAEANVPEGYRIGFCYAEVLPPKDETTPVK